MSSYTHKTYIVFLDLPEEISAEIDKIRAKYSPNNFKKWKAHLTLKQDEDYLVSQHEIEGVVRMFAGDMSEVRLEFDGFKIHETKGVGCNIYIGIKDNLGLVGKIKKLSQQMEPMIDPDSPRAFGSTKWEQSDDFYPHISIKGAATKEQAEELLGEIEKEKLVLPKIVVCKTITLANWQEDHWQAIDTFQLQRLLK